MHLYRIMSILDDIGKGIVFVWDNVCVCLITLPCDVYASQLASLMTIVLVGAEYEVETLQI